MAREGEGEKLESIAAEERVPAARVRQRVSRMRRWMKERWLAELAAVAALAILAILVARLLRRPKDVPVIAPRPEPPPSAPFEELPLDRARALRADALRACDEAAWQRCLDQLDEAARLDPAGDGAPDVAAARERARNALEAPPAPVDPRPPPTEKTLVPTPPVLDKVDTKNKAVPKPTPPPAPSATAIAPPVTKSNAKVQESGPPQKKAPVKAEPWLQMKK
jgi:hypothetical protein